MLAREFDRALWHYRGRYIRTIDGDTLLCTVELPFDMRAEMRVRLFAFSRAERDTEEGKLAKQKMIDLFASERYTGSMLEAKFWPLRIITEQLPSGGEIKSFERYVATVYLVGEDGVLTDLKTLL